MTMLDGMCECCQKKKPLVGVASVPGIPVSIAWCHDCLQAGVIPYSMAVAQVFLFLFVNVNFKVKKGDE